MTELHKLTTTLLQDKGMINLHSHTQFCDGRASMQDMACAANKAGFSLWGFSPHSPVNVPSPCNMKREDVSAYIEEAHRIKQQMREEMEIIVGMEIDYLSESFGPSLPYFRSLPLDYRIGSVHFVPTKEGELVDCDGSATRFKEYLRDKFDNDLEYVVKKYFEQVLAMIHSGGFDILGHLDKIAGNASEVDETIEEQGWYRDLIKEVIREAVAHNLIIEINTKAFSTRGRFYPAEKWWPLLKESGAEVIFSTDAHYTDKVDASYSDASLRWQNVTTPG